MPIANMMEGPRLEFALVPAEPQIGAKYTWDKKKGQLVTEEVVHENGYMLYTPAGHSYFLTQEEAVDRGYMRDPEIMNFESIRDRQSNAGKFKYGIDEKTRREGYEGMIRDLIRFCSRGGRGTFKET